ncbi:3-deoxy-D-manno-octulosonic acid transferase [Psychroserpens sp. SPM9]|uniref:3-deoxy-D-manno-octulosonic acid transferase n=1 Tax=Psychroserpens sp. SPM9 TaxID=2975598 RepID=UPI0021A478AF|nr:glycosyltransferase N-terminal domain-containing protein [Psychroserpens sp. SPM9]MDG5490058.1 glycosyltransferase N-terminal domain-containing protein [Psychroserpens sp. SPM9]
MYDLGIYLLSFILKVLAIFNTKIKLGVKGRRQTFDILRQKIKKEKRTFWFHCASLGEYEQGLPVFEMLRQTYPEHQIVLTFFSPSGYEIRKNTKVADVVVYLPLDTKTNAKQFLELVQPELTLFVKYDIWPNILLELKHQNRRAILISALFRKQQSYFKFYGGKRKQALFAFEHIFVQNESSKILLSSIDYNHSTIAGDTRFDRVSNQLTQNNNLDFISEFKQQSTCIVIGSSWPEDEDILIPYINKHASERLKFVIAPHEIKANHIKNILSKLEIEAVLFSEKDVKTITDYHVFIIDTIGLLTKIYSYADIAYVGGAMGSTGLHNILEPAVFGVPIVIGKNYEKFPEASVMIEKAGVISVKNESDSKTVFESLTSSQSLRESFGSKNANFIKENKGAVVQIMDYLRI